MNVRVEVQFESLNQDAWDSVHALARSVTDDPCNVRVFPLDNTPDWLAVEFTMPSEPQLEALDKIDRAVRFWAWERLDSIIRFPMSAAERARADRKNQRRRERRRALRAARTNAENADRTAPERIH